MCYESCGDWLGNASAVHPLCRPISSGSFFSCAVLERFEYKLQSINSAAWAHNWWHACWRQQNGNSISIVIRLLWIPLRSNKIKFSLPTNLRKFRSFALGFSSALLRASVSGGFSSREWIHMSVIQHYGLQFWQANPCFGPWLIASVSPNTTVRFRQSILLESITERERNLHHFHPDNQPVAAGKSDSLPRRDMYHVSHYTTIDGRWRQRRGGSLSI